MAGDVLCAGALAHVHCPASGCSAAERCSCGRCARVLELAVVVDCLVERLALAQAAAPDAVARRGIVLGSTWEAVPVSEPVLVLCEAGRTRHAAAVAGARRELLSTVGWCPPFLSAPLSVAEVQLVLGFAQAEGGGLLTYHGAGYLVADIAYRGLAAVGAGWLRAAAENAVRAVGEHEWDEFHGSEGGYGDEEGYDDEEDGYDDDWAAADPG